MNIDLPIQVHLDGTQTPNALDLNVLVDRGYLLQLWESGSV